MIIIFWDYDGTLVDTEILYKESLESFLTENKFLIKSIDNKFFYNYISGKYPEDFLNKLEEYGYIHKYLNIDSNKIKQYYTCYFNKLNNGKIKISQNIDKIINKFSKLDNIIMCITSSTYNEDYKIKSKNVSNEILDKVFNINKNIYLCGAIEGCKFKPQPDIFLYAFKDIIEKFNLNIQKNDQLLIIEDSIAGCQAAKKFKNIKLNKIKIDIIGYLGCYLYKNNAENNLKKNGADIVAENSDELLGIIEKICIEK